MEFKLNGTAEEALQQINDKQYALPFAADSRKVLKMLDAYARFVPNDTWNVTLGQMRVPFTKRVAITIIT